MTVPDMVLLGMALGSDSLFILISAGARGVGPRFALTLNAIFVLSLAALLYTGCSLAGVLHAGLHRFALQPLSRVLAPVHPTVVHAEGHAVLSLVGAAILAGLGVALVLDDRRPPLLAVRGLGGLAALALAVGVDAAVAGLALGMMEGSDPIRPALVVGGTIWGMGVVGAAVGRGLRRSGPRRVRAASGCLLVALAVRTALGAL